MTTRDAAIAFCRRGWSPLPIPHRSKNPGFNGWERTRIQEADVSARFNGQPQNIGILLGEPSGWVVDVDLDHARCVELADQYLPPTPAVFGRPGNPHSHRIYRVSAPVATKKHKSRSAGMLVELRSTGMQTVFPPSTHESGEPITWDVEGAEPALVDPGELLKTVEALANAVRVELGEKPAPRPVKATREKGQSKPDRKSVRATEKLSACAAAMMRMKIADHNDGSGRLFAAACRVVEHDLGDEPGLQAIREYSRQRPFPKDWSDSDILQRIRDAEKKVQRGIIAREVSDSGKRKVVINTEEHRVVTETVAALAVDDTIFHRGGVLVRVIRDYPQNDAIQRAPGAATISFLPQAALRERMTKYIEFTQFAQRGENLVEVLAHPPQWLVAAEDWYTVYTGKFIGWGVVPGTAGQHECADDYALFIYR